MRRAMLVLAVVTSFFVAASARAEQMRAPNGQAAATRNGPVAKLIELERRKNEWLRQRLGR